MAKKPRVKWYGKQVEKAALDAAMKALITGGEAILTEAINETPVDTGTLRRSGTVTKGGCRMQNRCSGTPGPAMSKSRPRIKARSRLST